MIKRVIGEISNTDSLLAEEARKRLDNLTKPQGSLGRLEEFARRLVSITGNVRPVLDRRVIFTFAGDHGVTREGVSAYPSEVTRQMVVNICGGGAGINALARHAGADVVVVDIGVDFDFDEESLPKGANGGRFISRKVLKGAGNIRKGPAMTRDDAIKCVEIGIDLAETYSRKGYNIFGTGEMGIGNTTPSSAIAAVLTGSSVSEVTGRGTGIDADTLTNKVKVIGDALRSNAPDPSDPLDVLSKVGGAEIGGIAGLIIGAAAKRVPVVIDGFISTAGALIAHSLEPKTADYMFAAHVSAERGHTAMLAALGLKPVLDLDLRLGEGTGAALAMLIIEAGLRAYREMATFSDAGVTGQVSQ